MKVNYAFKQRLTCILSNIMDSAWCNLNYKPLLLFGFKSVLRMGELEGDKCGKERIWSHQRKRGSPGFSSAHSVVNIQLKQLKLTRGVCYFSFS